MGHARHVAIVPIGPFAPPRLRALGADLERALDWDVRIVQAAIDPAPAFDRARQQYHASRLLVELDREEIALPFERRLAVTDLDLFEPVFTHLIGLAHLGGRAAIVSTHRLHPPPTEGPAAGDVLRERLFKEALHELGHACGLVHCPVSLCVMSPVRDPEELDIRDAAFCPRCAAQLGTCESMPHASGGSHERT